MRTALDTNVLSALLSNEASAPKIVDTLSHARQAGALVISGIVYVELLAYPRASESFMKGFLADTGIALDFEFQDVTWTEAGRRYAKYANRRRRATGQGPKRLLADFLIGAHALTQADRLMTLDVSRYRTDFPELDVHSV